MQLWHYDIARRECLMESPQARVEAMMQIRVVPAFGVGEQVSHSIIDNILDARLDFRGLGTRQNDARKERQDRRVPALER
ncbi:hypothetical protein C3E99_03075 [Sphingopyxis sp. MG]|nr:hypothetical protein C3E99_03075 [Sphingopyxis sp. MG]